MTRLVYRATLQATMGCCFDLVRDVDVHCETSVAISGRAIAGRRTGMSELGDETRWSARYFGIAWELTTRITEFDRPYFFADEMVRGPFRAFGHRYTFQDAGEGETLFEDEFSFESPFGLIGLAADYFFMRRLLGRALVARGDALKSIAERRWGKD